MQRRWLAVLVVAIGVVVAVLVLRGDPRTPKQKLLDTVVAKTFERTRAPSPAARKIAGTVLFDGKPIAGATVRLRNTLALAEISVVTR